MCARKRSPYLQNPQMRDVGGQRTRHSDVYRVVRGPWRVRLLTPVQKRLLATVEAHPLVEDHRAIMTANGRWQDKRRAQLRGWMWHMVENRVLSALREHPDVKKIAPQLEADVLAGKLTPTLGAKALLVAFGIDPVGSGH